MKRMSWWIIPMLSVACACGNGGAGADEADASRASQARQAPQPEGAETGPRAPATSAYVSGASSSAPHPETPEEVVIALIEAFQAGDQAGVEALWARDGGTWRDAAGFQARAAYFQKAEFDLDPGSITTDTSRGVPLVVVMAKQDGQDYIWSFMVAEIDGKLRAGGVESRPSGMP